MQIFIQNIAQPTKMHTKTDTKKKKEEKKTFFSIMIDKYKLRDIFHRSLDKCLVYACMHNVMHECINAWEYKWTVHSICDSFFLSVVASFP